MSEEEVHPDVEVVSRFRSEPYRGRDGFQDWIEEINRHFEEWRMVVDDWRDADDRVVALGSLQLRGRSSGLQLEESAGALVELADGKVLRLYLFGDHAEALEAAGLRE